jgi:hypothetical protein
MDRYPPFDRPSLRNYRHQRFWQIILPIVLFSLLIVVAGGFTIIADGELNRLWADVSIIWLVAPLLFLAIIFLAILIGMIYLLYMLTKGTPRITRKIQNIFTRIEQETCRVSNSAVKPVVWIHQFQSGLKSLIRIIRPIKKEGKNYGRDKTSDTI